MVETYMAEGQHIMEVKGRDLFSLDSRLEVGEVLEKMRLTTVNGGKV